MIHDGRHLHALPLSAISKEFCHPPPVCLHFHFIRLRIRVGTARTVFSCYLRHWLNYLKEMYVKSSSEQKWVNQKAVVFPSNKVVRHPLKSEPSFNSRPRVNRSTTGNRAVRLHLTILRFNRNKFENWFVLSHLVSITQWINPHPLILLQLPNSNRS